MKGEQVRHGNSDGGGGIAPLLLGGIDATGYVWSFYVSS